MEAPRVSPRVFRAIQTMDVEALSAFSDMELRPVLTSLVRMSLIASLDKSQSCDEGRSAVLRILSRIELVNSLVSLLSIDFHLLETDVRKEIALRSKLTTSGASSSAESILVPNLNLAPALEFERSDATRRLRLVLAELIQIIGQIQSIPKEDDGSGGPSTNSFIVKPSELFDHLVYLPELCDVLATAMAELPNLLPPQEVAEALLRLKYGPEIICHMVANQPDSFRDVVNHLLRNGDKQDEVNCNAIRQRALLLLCQMNPSQTLFVRTSCIEMCRLPSLVILLALIDSSTDLVAFMSSLLLGTDQQVRSWISYFIRNATKKHQQGSLSSFRDRLLENLRSIVDTARDFELSHKPMTQELVIRGSAFLRLYTALRGIAGLKLSEEESSSLLDLITCKAPATAAGVKFVSLGLCMFIACNSLIITPEAEKRAVAWIHWLVEQAPHFEKATGLSASFGEMLLLMAIHFHSNQLNAIGDLVCQTLGMKIVIRTNSMSRKISHVFTHELFNEQAVAAHAVRVPVTPSLNANTSGFLPVHCIHQLLKSRAFSKHKVPIKDWIYKQICQSMTPVHPVMVTVIEVFVNSILVPASNRVGSTEQTNEPITEEEIKVFFTGSSFDKLPDWLLLPKSSRPTSPIGRTDDDALQSHLASQVLLLYYVLLYENVRMSHTKAIMAGHRRVFKYSQELFASLPIKYLLQTAEKEQESFGCIFPQLLRLCLTHFPHLCLVQDWLRQEKDVVAISQQVSLFSRQPINVTLVREALSSIKSSPLKLTMLMQQMLMVPAKQKWEASQLIIMHVKDFLDEDVPPQLHDLFRDLWFSMNDLYPRKLWAATVHYMCANRNSKSTSLPSKITQDDPILDPLTVLRCDRRAFQVAPILEVILYILKACLAASRVQLQQHIQENPILDRNQSVQVSSDVEREELKNALVATQESAAIQILLEAVLENGQTQPAVSSAVHQLSRSNVNEVKLICSYIHEAFISDPNLAKLVHFQGYPVDYLPVTVTGIPSMHICLDFVPELLRQPELDKQVFAIDLVSHLSIQYALPKSYSTARLAVNTLSTLLAVLTHDERMVLMSPVLPSLVRFCKAFPPITEDVVALLMQYGRICVSESCLETFPVSKLPGFDQFSVDDFRHATDADLAAKILATFSDILENSVLEQRLF